MDLNNVILIGRLTKDIELTYTKNSTALCKFSLAVNGYNKDDVSFFEVIAWNKTAENIAKYIGKGSKVCVEGSLRQERWEKDGKKFSKVIVNAGRVHFLDTKGQGKREQEKESLVEEVFNSAPDDGVPY